MHATRNLVAVMHFSVLKDTSVNAEMATGANPGLRNPPEVTLDQTGPCPWEMIIKRVQSTRRDWAPRFPHSLAPTCKPTKTVPIQDVFTHEQARKS